MTPDASSTPAETFSYELTAAAVDRVWTLMERLDQAAFDLRRVAARMREEAEK